MVIQVIKIFSVQFICVLVPSLLDLLCFYLVFTISVLYCVHLWIKCYTGISNFLEEITSVSQSIVFLYFFALFIEEGLFVSPCYSLELCIWLSVPFPFSFLLASLLPSAICKAFSENHFAFLYIFSIGTICSLPPVQYYGPLSIVLQAHLLLNLIL